MQKKTVQKTSRNELMLKTAKAYYLSLIKTNRRN